MKKFNTFTHCRLPFWLRPSLAQTCCWSLASFLVATKSLHAVVLMSSVGSFDQVNMEWNEGRCSFSLLKDDVWAFTDFALMSHSWWFRDCKCQQWSISRSSISASLSGDEKEFVRVSCYNSTYVWLGGCWMMIGSMEVLLWAHFFSFHCTFFSNI